MWLTPHPHCLPVLLYSSVGWLYKASLVAQMVKRLPAMWETLVRSLCWEDPLEKEMATHSSTVAWKIPWTKEPGRLQSMGLQRVGHNWVTSLSFFFLLAFEISAVVQQFEHSLALPFLTLAFTIAAIPWNFCYFRRECELRINFINIGNNSSILNDLMKVHVVCSEAVLHCIGRQSL